MLEELRVSWESLVEAVGSIEWQCGPVADGATGVARVWAVSQVPCSGNGV